MGLRWRLVTSGCLGCISLLGIFLPLPAQANTLGQETPLPHPGGGTAAVAADGTVYVTGNDGRAAAFRPDGTVRFLSERIGSGGAPAIGADGTIYYSGTWLYACNPDLSVKWIYENGGGGVVVPASDGTVYVANGALHAVDVEGRLQWIFWPKEPVTSPPVLDPDRPALYVATATTVYSIDRTDADIHRQIPVSPAAEDIPVYAPLDDEGASRQHPAAVSYPPPTDVSPSDPEQSRLSPPPVPRSQDRAGDIQWQDYST